MMVATAENIKPMLEPDCKMAERFLTLLGEEAGSFTFQGFDDLKCRHDKKLTTIINASLDEAWDRLVDLNNRGAGIFVTVNQTDGKGRKASDITRLRALWKEDDHSGTPPLPLDPHIVVETSPGKHHEYLLIDDALIEGDEWERVQERIVQEYGSDPNAKDRARVLRLPGFFHMKDPSNPHLVRIVREGGGLPYQWPDVIKALPPVDERPRAEPAEPGDVRKLPEARAALRFVAPECEYLDWLSVGMALHHATNNGKLGLSLWDEWSAGADCYNLEEPAYRWQTFSTAGNATGQTTIKTVFDMAYKAGWDGKVTGEDCGLPGGLPMVDISKLRVGKAIKTAIETGKLDGCDNPRLKIAKALITAKVLDENILSVLLDQRNGIATDARKTAETVIDEAREEIERPIKEAIDYFKDVRVKVKGNAGFPFLEESLNNLLIVDAGNTVEYERIRGEFRASKTSLRSLDKALDEHRQVKIQNEKVTGKHKRDVPSSWPYEAANFGTVWNMETKNGTVPISLCNFHAKIKRQVIHDDGIAERSAFEIDGELKPSGKRLASAQIPFSQFNGMGWITANWGNQAVVTAGMSIKDHLRCAIQRLSPNTETTRVYAHIGWRKINNEWRYLHHGGALGANDNRDDITVDASGEAMQRYRFPDWDGDIELLRAAIAESMVLLDVAPDLPEVGYLALATVYRAPTYSFHRIDQTTFFAGMTGAMKSELTAAMLAHFGDFTSRDFPATWEDTPTDLEIKASRAKDALFVIDDFKPLGGKSGVDRLHAKADRIIRGAGNQSGRGRRKANLEAQPSYYPRCFIASTGEDIPRGESLRGRMTISEIKKGDVSADTITQLQNAGAHNQLALAMRGFIQWLAGQADNLTKTLPDEARAGRQRDDLKFEHARARDNYGSLVIGLRLFLDYALDAGAINQAALERLLTDGEKYLSKLMDAQAEFIKDADEVGRFISLLQSAFTAGHAHLSNPKDNGPPEDNPHLWGWRRITETDSKGWVKSIDGEAILLKPFGARIGWIDSDGIYLDPQASFEAGQVMATRQGQPFEFTQRTLWRRMRDKKLLIIQDSSHGNTSKKKVGGRTRGVIHLHKNVFDESSTGSTLDENNISPPLAKNATRQP